MAYPNSFVITTQTIEPNETVGTNLVRNRELLTAWQALLQGGKSFHPALSFARDSIPTPKQHECAAQYLQLNRWQSPVYAKKPSPPPPKHLMFHFLWLRGSWIRCLAEAQSRHLGTGFYYTVPLPTLCSIHKTHKSEFRLQRGPTLIVFSLMSFFK